MLSRTRFVLMRGNRAVTVVGPGARFVLRRGDGIAGAFNHSDPCGSALDPWIFSHQSRSMIGHALATSSMRSPSPPDPTISPKEIASLAQPLQELIITEETVFLSVWRFTVAYRYRYNG